MRRRSLQLCTCLLVGVIALMYGIGLSEVQAFAACSCPVGGCDKALRNECGKGNYTLDQCDETSCSGDCTDPWEEFVWACG